MSDENLIPFNERTEKEQREIARQGGIASGEARRAKKELRLALEALLEKEYDNNKGGKVSGAELLAYKQFDKALKGDTRAFEVVRDTAGQKPIEKVMIAEVDQSVIDEVERMVLEEES